MDQTTIDVRRAVPADRAALADLWATLLAEQAALDVRLAVAEDAAKRWANDFPEWIRADVRRLFVAETGGEVVGFVSAQPWYPPPIYAPFTAVYISELYVVPSARRQGVGRDLVAAVQDWAVAFGATQIRLGVLAGNAAGMAFWAAVGGTPFSTTVMVPVGDAKRV